MGEQRVRIIAGELKGRKFSAPQGRETRPTTDRVREAVFSTLESRGAILGASVLDAYSGSGALALEALSRGASHATLVEVSSPAFRLLQSNVTKLGVEDRASLIRGDVSAALSRPALPGVPFSLLFFDPPYRMVQDQTRSLLEKHLLARKLVQEGAVLVWEHSGKDDVSAMWPDSFLVEEPRRYGDVAVSIATFRADGERP